MGTIHTAPKTLGAGFQLSSRTGQVHVRSFGDTLTNAGQLAVVAAVQTYYGGIAGATIGPPTASAGGAAVQQAALSVSPTGVDVLVKPGDEATVAASLAAVLTGANCTHNVTGSTLFGTVN
jgi:hypothetical protein